MGFGPIGYQRRLDHSQPLDRHPRLALEIGTPVYLRVRARDNLGNLEPYPSGDGDAWFVPQSYVFDLSPVDCKIGINVPPTGLLSSA